MAEILSQSQIDLLLSTLTKGDQLIEEQDPNKGFNKKVKEYDFRSPKLFTREQLKLLFSIYENYARILSSYITGMLQTYSLVEIIEVEEQQYYEYNNALPDSVLAGLVDLAVKDNEEQGDLVIIEMAKDIGYCSIDRLLGGIGQPLEKDREYTEIETGILEYFFRAIVNLMKNVWIDYLEINPRLMKLETNSRILQGISADESVVIVVMNILVNETQGKMTICIPSDTLELLFQKKKAQTKKNVKRGDQLTEAQRKADIFEEINRSELEITGILGTAEVLFQELLELEAGDIIKLNKPVHSAVDLYVEDTPWFKGEMGTFRKKRSVQITDTNRREEVSH